jgi:DNA modification methylase
VEKLFEGGKANMMLTDPPYGVDYASKNSFLNKCDHGARIQREIKNDKNKNYKLFFVEFMNIVPFTVYNTIYVFIGRSQIEDFLAAMRESGITISVFLVWVKNTFVLGRADYHSKFEFVLYGWKGKHRFYGGQNKTTVLQEAKPTASTLHPTMKPVSLLMELINDGSRNGDGVYDPFGGSGSTLIACERMNRVCYTIEIEPYYCDVIIQRFKKFTGQEPICLA